MFNPFAKAEVNLGRAGWLLIIAFLGSGALAIALEGMSIRSDYVMLFPWITSPFTAWFISKAAKVQGRNALAYGLLSLLPPIAVFAFLRLYQGNHKAHGIKPN